MNVQMRVKYHPYWSQEKHEFEQSGNWHFMTYDYNGYAFCVDVLRMDGIVFSVSTYDEKPVMLVGQAVEQLKKRFNAAA
jgi:hypothetical protein